jgi:hypothetical protein
MRVTPFKMFLLITFLVSSPWSSPIYYTFTGVVSTSSYTEMSEGSNVQYILMVDTERNGKLIHHEQPYTMVGTGYGVGAKADHNVTPEDEVGCCFYVELISTDFIGPFQQAGDKQYWGYETVQNGAPLTKIMGSDPRFFTEPLSRTGANSVQISTSYHLNDWYEGLSGFSGNLYYGNPIQSSLTLTSISDSNPAIPEPSCLFALGLLFIAAPKLLRRKS